MELFLRRILIRRRRRTYFFPRKAAAAASGPPAFCLFRPPPACAVRNKYMCHCALMRQCKRTATIKILVENFRLQLVPNHNSGLGAV
ncbi:hypothetical protein EON66_06280 [archaeon]|nr:MAG: hypothetical protein EON66_06280 [archaeon]